MIQENAHPEDGADPRKYEVGASLIFDEYNPDERVDCPGPEDEPFRWGDLLVVGPRNGCGMGIDVRRERDGREDMVWPEEVVLAKTVSPLRRALREARAAEYEAATALDRAWVSGLWPSRFDVEVASAVALALQDVGVRRGRMP